MTDQEASDKLSQAMQLIEEVRNAVYQRAEQEDASQAASQPSPEQPPADPASGVQRSSDLAG